MHHDEMYRDVRRVLADRYGNRSFALLDLGCGSARHLAGALQGRSVSRYLGYDLADVALTHAARNLAGLGCRVELCHGDLLDAVRTNSEKFDLIFTSFALHHLSSADKALFFRSAYPRLNADGMLLLIDTVRNEGEERESHLDHYWAWLRSECDTLSQEALDLLGAHIRNCDFPETTAALSAMATRAGFRPGVEVSRFRWHYACSFTLFHQRFTYPA
jgi:cyclopropane fatty-acyl-phospholipid synthase-like methyltransferase